MKTLFRIGALALAAAGMAVSAVPAEARDYRQGYAQSWQQSRDYRDRYGYDTRYYGRGYHSEALSGNTRAWRGDDGRYYCRKSDGTTGLIIGAAAGALVGHAVDGGSSRTLGTVIGGGAAAAPGQR